MCDLCSSQDYINRRLKFTYDKLLKHNYITVGANVYSFTITLDPTIYKLRARSQLKTTISSVKTILSANCEKYILVAELTNSANIHYHCLIQCDDTIRLLDDFKMVKGIGSVFLNKNNIKNHEQLKKALAYMMVEVDKTYNIVNSRVKTGELYDVYFKYKKQYKQMTSMELYIKNALCQEERDGNAPTLSTD